MHTDYELMMKCDMCYDRTSIGKRPMCATVCPSQALFFGTQEHIDQLRPRSRSINEFHFGAQTIHTKVRMMVPRESIVSHIDVADAMFANDEYLDADDVMLAEALFELPILPNG
jgi:Fe-S-cluster-containing dehydrogenase component